jgi:hypothetical protein
MAAVCAAGPDPTMTTSCKGAVDSLAGAAAAGVDEKNRADGVAADEDEDEVAFEEKAAVLEKDDDDPVEVKRFEANEEVEVLEK